MAETTRESNLCLAGGVALNCVANGKIVEEGLFEGIWVQPAAGDAGGALGAALTAHHMHFGAAGSRRSRTACTAAFSARASLPTTQQRALAGLGANVEVRTDDELLDEVADRLDQGFTVGWFQDRMEFGPRALGARSIIADARRTDMQRNLNLRIKFRESFRPFAPAVLAEHASGVVRA